MMLGGAAFPPASLGGKPAPGVWEWTAVPER